MKIHPNQNFGGGPSPLSPVVNAPGYHCPPLKIPQSAENRQTYAGGGGGHSRTVYLFTHFLPLPPLFLFSLFFPFTTGRAAALPTTDGAAAPIP